MISSLIFAWFLSWQNFAAQMAGGFDEKAGGAQMGVMQGPMVSKHSVHVWRCCSRGSCAAGVCCVRAHFWPIHLCCHHVVSVPNFNLMTLWFWLCAYDANHKFNQKGSASLKCIGKVTILQDLWVNFFWKQTLLTHFTVCLLPNWK